MTHASRASSPEMVETRNGCGNARSDRFTLLRHALLALSLGFAAWPSLADDDCDVPVQQWQSREAVRRMAVAQGWQVQRLKIDDGCYEIRGIDAQGRAFKAKIDPQTLTVIKIKRKSENKHPREPAVAPPDASRAAGGDGTPPPASAPAASPRDSVDR